MGTVTLKMYEGKLKYNISSASIIASHADSKISIWMEYNTEEEPFEKNFDGFKGHPNSNIQFQINDINELRNFKVKIHNSFDEELGEYVSDFYFYEHNDIDKNVIKIKHKNNNVYNVNWTGITDDINFYDGSKPRTKVEVLGEFILKEKN